MVTFYLEKDILNDYIHGLMGDAVDIVKGYNPFYLKWDNYPLIAERQQVQKGKFTIATEVPEVTTVLLRCLRRVSAKYLLREIHEKKEQIDGKNTTVHVKVVFNRDIILEEWKSRGQKDILTLDKSYYDYDRFNDGQHYYRN